MKKILAVLANYGTEQLDYLKQVVEGLRSFKKYEVKIVVHSNIPLDIPGIDVVNIIKLDNYQLLPLTCKNTIWINRNDFDVFLYGENDHLFLEHHVDKHLEYEKIIPNNRITGLIQYEVNDKKELYYPAYHASYDWDMNSVETYGGKKFAHFTNIHQATFILSKAQLLRAGEFCDFTKLSDDKARYSVKCKVNTDVFQHSGFKKLICISEFDQNLIHHLPNIYINGDKGRLRLGSWDSRMRDKLKKLLVAKRMKFIAPIPDKKYYLWQTLVQIANFREMGYEQDFHIPVICFDGKKTAELTKMMESKTLKCHFYAYDDTRKDKSYAPSMKPWLMGKYFEQFPEERTQTYCYLDADCIFTQPMDFAPFMEDDSVWYGSDTRSYTGEKYVKAKGDALWYEMLEIAGLDPVLIDGKIGWEVGAQYFIKNCTADLWFEIEETSVKGYAHMNATKDKYHPEGQKHHIQVWCSEMYYTQYIALKHGIKLQVSPDMQFLWCNHNVLDWFKKPFFHNAGVPKDNHKDFCKVGYYGKSPFGKDLSYVDVNSASYKYAELIKRTEKYFPDLIWD